MLNWILDHRGDLVLQGAAALHEAPRAGRADFATRLLAAGVPVDRPLANGATPLLATTAEGHTEIVHTLLERRVNARARDLAGRNIEEYMAPATGSITARIDQRAASRACRPTDDLADQLASPVAAHAQIREMIR